MISDTIADMLIRIKNGSLARKDVVSVPYSKTNEKISQILVEEGFLKEVKVKNSELSLAKKNLELSLKYEGKTPVIVDLRRISKPGLRVYASSQKIPRVKLGFGITIVSTPGGLMTGYQAKKKNLGGEVICQVW